MGSGELSGESVVVVSDRMAAMMHALGPERNDVFVSFW
jgi:hypothetical protein